jgi:hypothetical protein
LFSEKERDDGKRAGPGQRATEKIQAGNKLPAVLHSFQAGDFIDNPDRDGGLAPAAMRAQDDPTQDTCECQAEGHDTDYSFHNISLRTTGISTALHSIAKSSRPFFKAVA